jgi:hypothetical protein
LALAYGISLVNLNTSGHSALIEVSRSAAEALLKDSGAQLFASSSQDLIRRMRGRLRTRLATAPLELLTAYPEDTHLDHSLNPAVSTAMDTSELFVGMTAGPYILVLKANDPYKFLKYAQGAPTHDVSIRWSRRKNSGRTWYIKPKERPEAYLLWFKLPEPLVDWIFQSERAKSHAKIAFQAFRFTEIQTE